MASTYVNISAPDFNPRVNCTIGTCPIHFAEVQYIPSLAGNVLFLAIFGLFLLFQAVCGFLYKTWSYNGAMIAGLILEIIGYVSRVQMHANPFKSNPFIIYLVTVTIAPAFFTAAIYLCFSRVIIYYGVHFARFSTKFYTIVFIVSDMLALILQAAGGAIADDADTQLEQDHGVDIMVAGLAWQVFSLTIFTGLCLDFRSRISKAKKAGITPGPVLGEKGRRMKFFLIGQCLWNHNQAAYSECSLHLAMSLSALFIFIRSIFRCAELSKGFNSSLANDEISYMVLEGAMMILATGLMTIFQPGYLFRDTWSNSGWSFGRKKPTDNENGSVSRVGVTVEVKE
ncbi:RTA1 like protein-domain-containing protein [Xylariales sp. PMI_506]|nr:RTA1 like protein-domain-containing protein [Xylariales sp. PMI_506]